MKYYNFFQHKKRYLKNTTTAPLTKKIIACTCSTKIAYLSIRRFLSIDLEICHLSVFLTKLPSNYRFFRMINCRKRLSKHNTKHQQTSYPFPFLHDPSLLYFLEGNEQHNTGFSQRAPSSGGSFLLLFFALDICDFQEFM